MQFLLALFDGFQYVNLGPKENLHTLLMCLLLLTLKVIEVLNLFGVQKVLFRKASTRHILQLLLLEQCDLLFSLHGFLDS